VWDIFKWNACLLRIGCFVSEAARIKANITDSVREVETLKSPRCIKTHLPLQMLPEQLWTVRPKVNILGFRHKLYQDTHWKTICHCTAFYHLKKGPERSFWNVIFCKTDNIKKCWQDYGPIFLFFYSDTKCAPVCSPILTFEILDQFSLNLVRTSCHWRPASAVFRSMQSVG
jgi:hypothetical protein